MEKDGEKKKVSSAIIVSMLVSERSGKQQCSNDSVLLELIANNNCHKLATLYVFPDLPEP